MEGKLVAQSVLRLADKDKLGIEEVTKLQDSINRLEILFDGLGFCLSEESDLLSQWRGYAADATGISVGFNRTYLEWLVETSRNNNVNTLNLNKVEYEADAHDKLVTPTYLEIKQLLEIKYRKHGLLEIRSDEQIAEETKTKSKADSDLLLKTISLYDQLFLLKSAAFKEEKEWRLVSHIVNIHTDAIACDYRTSTGKIIPYCSYELKELVRAPIFEVVLGPKHSTPIHVIKKLLVQNGFGNNVRIRKSTASYR